MGKGFRHGSGGDLKKVPVLDDAFPADVSVDAVDTSVTFEVVIAKDGNPPGYTYQWYYDNNMVDGQTGPTYTRQAAYGSHKVYCIVTNEAGFVNSRVATVTASKKYLYGDGTGWQARAKAPNNDWATATSPTVTKNSDGTTSISLYVMQGATGRGGIWDMKKNVDLTEYQTLKIKCTANTPSNSYGVVGVGLSVMARNAAYYETNAVARCNLTNTSSAKTFSLNISSVTGSYDIAVGVKWNGAWLGGGTSSAKVYDVWLE